MHVPEDAESEEGVWLVYRYLHLQITAAIKVAVLSDIVAKNHPVNVLYDTPARDQAILMFWCWLTKTCRKQLADKFGCVREVYRSLLKFALSMGLICTQALDPAD